MIVDDEPLLRDIFSEWFTGIGRRLFLAENGARALEILAQDRIDLIITDVQMPVLDGIGMLRKIKAAGQYAPAVIFVSGFSEIEPREAYGLGVEAFLAKPIERDELIRLAKASLEDRNELWKQPQDPATYQTLTSGFASLAAAINENRIAFGRGGFCIETLRRLTECPVNVEIDFSADRFVLSGQGVVRWLSPGYAGIELTSVAEESRQRAADLANRGASFIPDGAHGASQTAG